MASANDAAGRKSDLGPRIVSALFLAGGALASAWWGGWPFTLVWFLLSGIVLREWIAILFPGDRIDTVTQAIPYFLLLASFFVPILLLIVGDFSVFSRHVLGAVALTAAAGGAFGYLRGWRLTKWTIIGCLYASLLFVSAILLRHSDSFGLAAILFLFAVVWGADVGAYFAGRTLGGPKLAPAISPNKTWSGFCGGMVTGVLLALGILAALGIAVRPMHAVIAALLALASVFGDLFESFFKRRFGVKDSGHIIPGHGGVMDRLDGFIFAAVVAAMIGTMRAGPDSAGAGLLAGW